MYCPKVTTSTPTSRSADRVVEIWDGVSPRPSMREVLVISGEEDADDEVEEVDE